MIKANKVKHLNKNSKHRKAMLDNMLTSLFLHERIESTLAKVKVARGFADKLITKAKNSLGDVKPEVILHNKREVMKSIKNRDVVAKLFSDIAPRYQTRPGGYTRILKIVNRKSDNSEMALLELVDRKNRDQLIEEKTQTKPKKSKSVETKAADKETKKKRSFFSRNKEKKE
ncbi:MAG: 50S ribosomal protein L17 [Leptospiraceae bacterium]|nr:50S ribosomal protein L17 [Leptospiraceae bacterium]MCK6380157.1 50S ribosomal protein L17 [Leptospiraceae bacterium]NUM41746.1 50S ribosomal protein L17 [Leptospiraceae bacterium]